MDSEVVSLVTDITFLGISMDWNSKPETDVVSLITQLFSACSSKYAEQRARELAKQIYSRRPKVEFVPLTQQILFLVITGKLRSEWKVISIIIQIIFLVSSMGLDSESELISLIKEIISVFNSKPDSDSELVSLITHIMRLSSSVDSDSELLSLIRQLISLKPEPELMSLIKQIISSFKSMNWEPNQFISLCPQVKVEFEQGKFRVAGEEDTQLVKEECRFHMMRFWRSAGKDNFYCRDCNGEDHEEYEKAPLEVKHLIHPKHPLQLVLVYKWIQNTRECYCCDEYLEEVFYYCSACDFAMNITCMDKPLVLSIHHPKWHEHTLALFPSLASFPCNLCALTHSTICPFYICPPCDFVVHQSCLSLPRVIRISRHTHRISFTPSFDHGGGFSCGVCRKKIDSDYGGYSCFKDGCSYAAHSRCATQKNVWDGIDLEEVPEEIEEEELEPFVRISHGIIQHFSHRQHHLRLDEDTGRDYDENKLCQACITPIYFGNFYSCVQCDFILHEQCANLSRKIYHPIHPHLLTLVGGYVGVNKYEDRCSACPWPCTSSFFYECGKKGCHYRFKLHVQCATISEPLVHESHHKHPLFLTSKPGEPTRKCVVCYYSSKETFNCIEGECEFSLCFGCATRPQKVRYKHDKHMLTLSYGEEASNWCEACEGKIDPKKRFYKCDEYCCVTLHIECLIGEDLYMKLGSSWLYWDKKGGVLPNDHHMTRPICFKCKKRCPQKIVFQNTGLIYCSIACIPLTLRVLR